MDASLYQPLFLTIVSVLCIAVGSSYIISSDNSLQEEGNYSIVIPLILSVAFIFFLGYRPISGQFVDTVAYALEYTNKDIDSVSMDWNSEWIWQWLLYGCKSINLGVSDFLTVIEAGYILTALFAIKQFMPSNPMLGMLFVWSSLMYFTFGVNGIRNGLACHIVLLALAFLLNSKYIIGGILCLISFGIHRSTILPIATMLTGLFLIKNINIAIYCWLFAIPISLILGKDITIFLSSLGFDDRMSSYTDISKDMSAFSKAGFRWDFLMYSSIPVLMAWYVCIKREIIDNWFNVICITYCLSNAFWILVIRSSFSNRFAYLSWFLYPIIIAYPLINMPIWEDQDKKIGYTLLAYCGFTIFMQVAYW